MKYSNEEKLSIITRYQQGERITTLSNELAISRSTPCTVGSNRFLRTALESR